MTDFTKSHLTGLATTSTIDQDGFLHVKAPGNQVVAFLSDFGSSDHYVGAVKGVIASINPDAHIIDITHDVRPQDVFGASYALFACYNYYPPDTLFMCVVDPGVGSERDVVYVETRQHRFLAPDNGLLSFVAKYDPPRRIITVNNQKYFLSDISKTFHGRDVFAPVAAHLTKGLIPGLLGPERKSLASNLIPDPVYGKDDTIGLRFIHADRFGNLVTNLRKEAFLNYITSGGKGRSDDLEVTVRVKGKAIRGLSEYYSSVPRGTLLTLFGSTGFLEIAVSGGSALEKLGIKRYERTRAKVEITRFL